MVDGLTTLPSRFDTMESTDRLEAAIKRRRLTIFARIDHAAGAQSVGLSLRPLQLLIFGSAMAGTPLMQLKESIAIDLPLKLIVWQDAAGKTSVSYNNPAWLAARHHLGNDAEMIVGSMAGLLKELTAEVVVTGHVADGPEGADRTRPEEPILP